MEDLYIADNSSLPPKEFQQLYQRSFNTQNICFQGYKPYVFFNQ